VNNCSRYRTPGGAPPKRPSLRTPSWGLNIKQKTCAINLGLARKSFRSGAATGSRFAIRGDRQHPFGSLAAVRAPRGACRSSGPGLCAPALRLVCLFEDEDAAGPSSSASGYCPSSERVSVRPGSGLAKINYEEEKRSLGGADACGDRPSNGKSRSIRSDVKRPGRNCDRFVVPSRTWRPFDRYVRSVSYRRCQGE
jgi:hypothetical protein